ncbi:MAG: hypothetical protein ACYC1Z_01220 [Georgenia sp.]
MARTIFAFLVAIDEYFPPVSALAGCRNGCAAVGAGMRPRPGCAARCWDCRRASASPRRCPPAVTRGERGISLGAPPGLSADHRGTEELVIETIRA